MKTIGYLLSFCVIIIFFGYLAVRDHECKARDGVLVRGVWGFECIAAGVKP